MIAGAERRIDGDGALEVLLRLAAATELGQHLRVLEVQRALIGRALDHRWPARARPRARARAD